MGYIEPLQQKLRLTPNQNWSTTKKLTMMMQNVPTVHPITREAIKVKHQWVIHWNTHS